MRLRACDISSKETRSGSGEHNADWYQKSRYPRLLQSSRRPASAQNKYDPGANLAFLEELAEP